MDVNDRVLRRRGTDARVGIVRSIRGPRADVDWPAPRRINGDGWHCSHIAVSSLIIASDAEVERRRSVNRTRREAIEAAQDRERVYLCSNVNPSARVANDGHPKLLPLMPGQVSDGKCMYCGAPVIARPAQQE